MIIIQGLSRVLLHLSATSGMSSFILYIGDADSFTYKINHNNRDHNNTSNKNCDKNIYDNNQKNDNKDKNDKNYSKKNIVKITENSYNKDNIIIRILSKDCHILLPNDDIWNNNYNYDDADNDNENDEIGVNDTNNDRRNNMKKLKYNDHYLHTQMGGGKFNEALKISFIDNNYNVDNSSNDNDYNNINSNMKNNTNDNEKNHEKNNEKNKMKNKAKIHAKIPLQFHEFREVRIHSNMHVSSRYLLIYRYMYIYINTFT
jgi:hypothetical protein